MNKKKIFGIIIWVIAMMNIPVYAETHVPVQGKLDILGKPDEPENRTRVGNSDHYICGGLIEAEDGTDLYNYTIDESGFSWKSVHVIDAKEELYVVEYYSEHGGHGEWEIMDGNFNILKSGDLGYANSVGRENAYIYLKADEIAAGVPGKTRASLHNAEMRRREAEKMRVEFITELQHQNQKTCTAAIFVIAIFESLYFIIINKIVNHK